MANMRENVLFSITDYVVFGLCDSLLSDSNYFVFVCFDMAFRKTNYSYISFHIPMYMISLQLKKNMERRTFGTNRKMQSAEIHSYTCKCSILVCGELITLLNITNMWRHIGHTNTSKPNENCKNCNKFLTEIRVFNSMGHFSMGRRYSRWFQSLLFRIEYTAYISKQVWQVSAFVNWR